MNLRHIISNNWMRKLTRSSTSNMIFGGKVWTLRTFLRIFCDSCNSMQKQVNSVMSKQKLGKNNATDIYIYIKKTLQLMHIKIQLTMLEKRKKSNFNWTFLPSISFRSNNSIKNTNNSSFHLKIIGTENELGIWQYIFTWPMYRLWIITLH